MTRMYRLDVIKTRLQTANVNHALSERLSFRQVAGQIYADQIDALRPTYKSSFIYRLLQSARLGSRQASRVTLAMCAYIAGKA